MSHWIVSTSSSTETKDSITNSIKSRIFEKNKLVESISRFEVPENLKFGSFDALIKLVDDLSKYDSLLEATERRIERQILELDPTFKEWVIISQRSHLSLDEYLLKFHWDDAKFPRTRTLQDNITILLSSVTKLDEEVKSKSQQFSDLKQQNQNISKKDQLTLMQRDLIDLLTPDVVGDLDFINTEHLTTVVVVIQRGGEKDWLSLYESLDDKVVPRSSYKLPGDDRDGNSLYRVVVFRSSLDSFKAACRNIRVTIRDGFVYDKNKYKQMLELRTQIEADLRKKNYF